MKNIKFLKKIVNEVGSQAELGRKLDVNRYDVYNWLNGRSKIPPRLVKKLVALSNGKVTEQDLRPDIFYDC